VANIEELESLVDFKHLADSSSTIDIENVAVEVHALHGLVLFHGFGNAHNTRDSELAAAQVEMDEALVKGESWGKELSSFLVDGALPEVKVLDVASTHGVFAKSIGHELHVFVGELALVEVQDQVLANVGNFEESGPDRLDLS